MRNASQRGTTLVEVAVAIAILAIAAGAALSAFLSTGRHALQRDRRAVLEDCARRELLVAVDILKYSGGALIPTTVATALPMPGGSPLPAVVTLSMSRGGGGAHVGVSVRAVDGAQTAALSATVASQAPVPGASLFRDGLVAAPSGAP